MLKSYDKYGPFYHMLMCLRQCWMSDEQCRPDQTPRSAASDLGLLDLIMSICPNT